jgi:hypothetical protein
MLNIALVALLTALQPSTPPRPPTPSQPSTPPAPELKGQACTARELVGTWEFTGKSTLPGTARVLKHFTPTHYFVLRIGANDAVLSGQGGPHTVAADGTYSTTMEHGFGEVFEKYRGASLTLQCRLNGDIWHIVGEHKDVKLNEQWRRVTATSAGR